MAKAAGDTRTSRWAKPVIGSREGEIKDLYFKDGRRVEYSDLSRKEMNAVKRAKKEVAAEMFQKLRNVRTKQVIDNGKEIEIGYTKGGIDHFTNDAMLTLSGKYFSEASMMRVNEILEKATYIPTPHGLTHPRTDGRELWFTYTDTDGRDIYFKVAYSRYLKAYDLYSVTDKI